MFLSASDLSAQLFFDLHMGREQARQGEATLKSVIAGFQNIARLESFWATQPFEQGGTKKRAVNSAH